MLTCIADGDKRFTAQDLLVLLAGDGLGGPFCGATAKAALDGNILQAIIGFVVGLPLLVMAAAFPFLKQNLSSNVRIRVASGSSVALLFLLFVTFIYVGGPSIYVHVAKSQQEHSYLTIGPIDSDFKGRALGLLWCVPTDRTTRRLFPLYIRIFHKRKEPWLRRGRS